jgi:putative pyruvate formate lyase activating enzyme
LGRYLDVSQNIKYAKFQISKKVPAHFSNNSSIEELWKEHETCLKQSIDLERQIDSGKQITDIPSPERSFLDLKIEIANRILRNCHFCTRRCGVNRTENKTGYCSCGCSFKVSSMFAHMVRNQSLYLQEPFSLWAAL